MKRGFKKWAEQKSEDLRKELGLVPSSPLKAATLATHLNIEVLNPAEIPHIDNRILDQLLREDKASWSALTLHVDGRYLIIHNSSHAPTRIESDLMHEIAHCVCGHQPAQIVMLPGLDFPLRSYNDDQEEEAKWFGGCLQIPRCALVGCAYNGMKNNQIATAYFASVSLIRFRRNVTGVDLQVNRS
jgi:Zn-dependent peptidase ImmA (M78 family)